MAPIIFEPTVEFIVPFLFILAIVFGVLQLTKGPFANKGVALVIGIAVAFFTASSASLSGVLWGYLPTVTWFFIAMFFIVFIMEIFGFRRDDKSAEEAIAINAGILIVLLGVGYTLKDKIPFDLPFNLTGEDVITIAILLIIASIFWAALKTGYLSGAQQIIRKQQQGKGRLK